ncbi:MAG TPA: NmrA/HSCARG family protein [Caulobacterales bacterium]|nr:NmrA/HSCARG family protein [Caulobacterales bacterium]
MSDKKIITVIGATGAQGGGLVRAIQSDPSGAFRARALTRDPNSDKAKELAALGAEVVQGDLDNAESIAAAFRGAYGAFGVTFFWAHYSAERETAEAKLMAEAAKAEGVQHFIWSTLEDVRKYIPLSDTRMPTIHGKYKVPHFEGKADGDVFFAQNGVPTTYLLTAFYWENLIYFGMNPKPDGQGRYAFTIPMGNGHLSGIAAEDIGKCAYGIFKQGGALIGERVGIAGDHVTGADMAATMARIMGKDIYYNAMPFDAYRALGFPGADDLGNMFQFYHDCEAEFTAKRNLDFTRHLNPELQSFNAWVEANKDRIPLA